MSSSVWYISISKKKIEFKKYPSKQKNKKTVKKSNQKSTNSAKKLLINLILASSLIFFLSVVSAAEINDTFHINLQTTFSNGTIETGTFTFTFNITDNSSTLCGPDIVYNHSISLATDTRGIVSLYLPTTGSGGGNLSTLNFDKQYYLCYYRDGTLKDVSQLGRVPYAFRATQVNLSEISVDTDFNMTDYNITDVKYGFFQFLGSLVERITKIFAIDADISNNLDVGGDVNVTGSVFSQNKNLTLGYEYAINYTGTAGIGDCPEGQFVQNTTTGGVECTAPAGGGDITGVFTTLDNYLYNGSSSGDVYLRFNGTRLNETIDLRENDTTYSNGSGLNLAGTVFSVAYGTDLLGWDNLTNYPSACPAGHAVQVIGDTLTCINISAQDSGTLDGYDSTFFMPLNTSVYGDFDFTGSIDVDGGWTSGGVTIDGGNLYAQTVYVYNITSLNVTEQNLTIVDDLIVYGNTELKKNLTVDTDTLFVDSNTDNVGIGTSNPGTVLSVFRSGGDAADIMHLRDTTDLADLVFRYTGSQSFQIRSEKEGSGDLFLHFNYGGNVGIGTVPVTKLHIVDATNFSTTPTDNGVSLLIKGGGGTEADGQVHSAIGLVSIGRTNPEAAIVAVQDGADRDYLGLAFYTHPGSDITDPMVEQVRIDKDGNVGIGTTDPNTNLEIVGDTNAQLQIRKNAVGDGTEAGIKFTLSTDKESNIGAKIYAIRTNVGQSGDSDLIFQTSDGTNLSTNMIIKDTGNVGIGTTTPGAPLHIEGNSDVLGGFAPFLIIKDTDTTASSHTATIEWQDNAGNSLGKIFANSGTDAGINFLNSANAYTISISDAGKVGIGTLSPDQKLHIYAGNSGQTANVASNLIIEDSGTNYLSFLSADDQLQAVIFGDATDNDRGGLFYEHDGDKMWFRVAAATKMLIDSDGNVGIGTTSPQQKLHVNGSAIINGTLNMDSNKIISLANGTSSQDAITLSQLQAVNASAVAEETDPLWTGNMSTVAFTDIDEIFDENLAVTKNLTVDTDTLFVDSNTDNVGIGTTEPLSAFHTAGTTGITWGGTGLPSFGLVTIGTGGTSGGSLFVNTPSFNSLYHSGLAIDGSYTNPGGVGTSIMNIKALGVNSGGGYKSNLAFYTTSNTVASEAMRIDSLGNVGIGTTTPQDKLNVVSGDINVSQGNIVIEKNTAPTLYITAINAGVDPPYTASIKIQGYEGRGKGIFLTDENTSNEWFIGETYGAIGLSLGYDTTTGSQSEYPPNSALFVDTNRNVGIGTTSPQQRLHVNGSAVINGTLNMDSNKIISLANGTSAQDAITLSQLQAVNATATGAGSMDLWRLAASGTAGTQDIVNNTLVNFTAGTGITITRSGSDITTGLADTAVTPGSYGGNIVVGRFTVDQQGRFTSASNTTIRTATTSVTGITQLTASVTSTANDSAATPWSVKTAYDLAASKLSTETDPYWTGNQSSYSTTAEILAFGYYNASDFVITDYFTKTDILGFSYYNLTDFDIADYFTSSEVLAFNYYNLTDFDIADYFTAAQILGFNYYNSTNFVITDYYTKTEIDGFGFYNITDFDINDYYTKTQVYNKTEVDGFSLSKWIDDLGDRGYTHLTNFTDDILWTTGFNATGDSRWLGVGEESDPLWTGNQSSYFTKSDILGFSYYNLTDFDINDYYLKSNPFGFWNDTYATFNKTYADTLYYGLSNPYGYYNSTNPQTETDPLWTGNFSNVAFINKANAFGAFNQSFDTNVLFVDATNDKVGIGTTSPTHKLNVAGTFNTTSGGSSLVVDANGNVGIGI